MTTDRGETLHKESIIIDGLEISRWDERIFRQMQQGGLTAVNATVVVLEGFRETVKNITHLHKLLDQYHSMVMPIRTVEDIGHAKRLGKVGIILTFQNTSPIEEDLDLLRIFYELGVRVIQLCYMERNLVGDGCLERTDCGLSRFGLEVIEEMNRLGILIDLSHVGYRTTMETIEASKRPIAFTHANPRALCDHPRNKTDEQIKALVKRGGVIGANVFPPFLAAGSRATMKDVIEAVEYLVKLAGIDHVGIGTDFTEGQPDSYFAYMVTGRSKKGPAMKLELPIVNPEGIRTAAEFPNLTKALLAHGYSESDVKKIMGENWLRLFSEVWVTEKPTH